MTTVVAGRVTCSGCSRTLCEYPNCPGTAKLEYHGYCSSHRFAYLGHLRDAEGNIDSEIYSCGPAGKFYFCSICANQPIADRSHVAGRRHQQAMFKRQNGVGMCRPLPLHTAMDRGHASQAESSRAFELPPGLPLQVVGNCPAMPSLLSASLEPFSANVAAIPGRTSEAPESWHTHMDRQGASEAEASVTDAFVSDIRQASRTSLPQEPTSSPSPPLQAVGTCSVAPAVFSDQTSDVQEPRQSHVDGLGASQAEGSEPNIVVSINDEMDEEDRCALCLDRRRTDAAAPCGHYKFCEPCCVDLQERGRPCPFCSGTVEYWLKIFC